MNIGRLKRIPVRELWKREDKDFTTWLEGEIDHLNEILDIEVTIEASEESVGPFRVDLYGEDNTGNKVIIENQLEKTDHDHLGKVLTYSVNLEAKTAIWITTKPREEHERVVEWLNEVTPDDTRFYLVSLEAIQIEGGEIAAPLFSVVKGPSIEAKAIGQEKKEFARRHQIRLEYWAQFINFMNEHNDLCRNLSPSKDHWIGIGLGMSGVSINLVATKAYVRCEVFINKGDQEINKRIFDALQKREESIRNNLELPAPLIWDRMDEKITSRIKYQLDEVNINTLEDWIKMNEFLKTSAERMVKVFRKEVQLLKKVNKEL